MKILALAMIGVLAQVGSCNIPEGDIEIRDCSPEDQKEGFECKAFYIDGKLIRKAYSEIPNPNPSPSPSNIPSPTPSPITTPDPGPIPTPKPSPKPSPSPNDEIYCVMNDEGNFNPAPENICPSCWTDYAALNNISIIDYWGISFRSKTPCRGVNCSLGIKVNVDITPHSKKPFLGHRPQGTETHKGCQPAEDSHDVPDIWVYPPNDDAGLCDPFSGSRYWCHHKPKANQAGPTKFEVQAPGKRSIIVPVP